MVFEPNLQPTILGPSLITKQMILNFLDSRPEVKNWVTTTSTSIVMASDQNVNYLSDLIRNKFPGVNFILAEVTSAQSDGWTDRRLWDFILNPLPSGKWPS